MQYFVNMLSEIAFTQHPLKNPLKYPFIHLEKYSRAKCFLDFSNSTSVWRIRSRDKFIYAATPKTYPGTYSASYFEPT